MKVLTPDMWRQLLPLQTKRGCTLMDVTQPAHYDTQTNYYCAVVAHDPEAFTVFARLFESMAAMFHRVPPGPDFYHTLWPQSSTMLRVDPSNEFVISARIRVSRNLQGFPLMGGLTLQQRREVEKILREALAALPPPYAGSYTDLSSTSLVARQKLVEEKVLSASSPAGAKYWEAAKVFRDFPDARRIFRSQNQSFELIAWIHEEDHLRLMLTAAGADVAELSDRMQEVLVLLDRSGLEWEKNQRLGYPQTCPTNLGTGLRCGMHLRVPGVVCQPGLFKRLDAMGLQARGVYGEDMAVFDGGDGVVDISNRGRAGSEKLVIETSLRGIGQLIEDERCLNAIAKKEKDRLSAAS